MVSRLRASWPRQLRRLVQLLVLVFVLFVFVVPQIGGARQALTVVTGINPLLVLAGIGLYAGALVAYARLTRLLLPVEHRPSHTIVFGAVLASTGVNHVVPGGAATTAAVNYRLLGGAGVPPAELSFALGAQSVGSAIVLNLILWVALVVSIPISGFHGPYVAAAVAGLLLMLLAALIVLGLTRGQERAGRIARWFARWIPGLEPDELVRGLRIVSEELVILGRDRRRLWQAVGLAAANWMLDAAALWVFLWAFGDRADPVGVLIAFGFANVLAAMPITPGGLGVVEAVLIPTIVGFGTPRAVAAVGVVGYRLVNFWAPIPAGGVAYVLVQRSNRAAARKSYPEMVEELLALDDRSAPPG